MPVPTPDLAHVAEAQAFLTSRFKNAAVVQGFVAAFAGRVQELENALNQLLYIVQLSNHPLGTYNGFTSTQWNILDQLGAIEGVTRNSRTDTDFLAAIRVAIRVHRSQGLGSDVLAVAQLVSTNPAYFNWGGGEWEVDVFNTTSSIVSALGTYLGAAGAAGTRGVLVYSVDANPVFRLDSGYGGVTSASLLASSYGGGGTAELTAAQEITPS